jgi:hypothetical protein
MATGQSPDADVICLVGPKGSGKTSLLKYWPASFEMRMHGCEDFGISKIIKTTESEARNRGKSPSNFIDAAGEDIFSDAKEFVRRPQETFSTGSHFFEISMRSGMDRIVELVDSPGELLFPETGRSQIGAEERSQNMQRLRVGLARAAKIVFAIPMVKYDESTDIMYRIRRLLEDLVSPKSASNLKTLVLAFTHCERRFVQLGNRAFLSAADPRMLRKLLKEQFADMPWAEAVQTFAQRPGHRVFLTASGSLGFVAGNGSMNIDPHKFLSDDPEPREKSLAELPEWQRDRLRKLLRYEEAAFGAETGSLHEWRPFLAADPFLCAIFDRPSAYCVELAGGAAKEPPPPPDAPETALKRETFFKRIVEQGKKVIFVQD